MRGFTSPLFSPWRGCLAQSSVLKRLVTSSGSRLNSLKSLCDINEPLWPLQESNLTLRHLWASGYQVILSYESQEALENKELWPEIPYWWANKRTADGVISYIDCKKHSGRPGLPSYFRILMHFQESTNIQIIYFPQRAFLFADWTWRLIGASSPRIRSNPCGRWPLLTGSVWASGWRSRILEEAMRAWTSSQETLWALFLFVLWLSHST